MTKHYFDYTISIEAFGDAEFDGKFWGNEDRDINLISLKLVNKTVDLALLIEILGATDVDAALDPVQVWWDEEGLEQALQAEAEGLADYRYEQSRDDRE